MKGKLWLNIALLAVVVALAALAYLKPSEGEPQYRLSKLKAADANSIQVEIAGAATISLERKGADWHLTAPLSARADSFNVQRLLGILEAGSMQRLEATGLARFDLNQPYARVTINGQTFSFGAANEVSREQYVLTEGAVYLVPLRYATTLPKNWLQLASKQLFAPEEIPVAFELKDFQVVQTEGKWQLKPPSDVSADDIARWVDEWRLASAVDLQPFSSRKPLSTLAIRLKDGRTVVVAVLQRDSVLTLARSDQRYEYQLPSSTLQRMLSRPAAAPEASPAK